jgi:hypothetical protein
MGWIYDQILMISQNEIDQPMFKTTRGDYSTVSPAVFDPK